MNGMYNGVPKPHMNQRPNSWQHPQQHQQQVRLFKHNLNVT